MHLMPLSEFPITEVHRPRTITALSIFFIVGATISLTASISLLKKSSFLDSMWRLNPRAHQDLSSLGLWSVVLMTTVSGFCAAAGIALWRQRRWGYWLAVGLIAINLVASITNAVIGAEPRAIVGVPSNTRVSFTQRNAGFF